MRRGLRRPRQRLAQREEVQEEESMEFLEVDFRRLDLGQEESSHLADLRLVYLE